MWGEFVKNAGLLWDEIQKKTSTFVDYAYANWGPAFCSARQWCLLRWQELIVHCSQLWTLCKPYIDHTISIVVQYTELLVAKIKERFPVFIESLSGQINYLWTSASNGVSKLME